LTTVIEVLNLPELAR